MSLSNNLSYCRLIWKTFKNDYTKYNVIRRNQFAALSIDYAGLDEINAIYPDVFFNDGGLSAQNFITTTWCEIGTNNYDNGQRRLHAEKRILEYFRNNFGYFSRSFSDNLPHTLVFFTYYSPCGKCTIEMGEMIRYMRRNFPNVRIIICYAKVYIYKSERDKMSPKNYTNYENCRYSMTQFNKFRNLEKRYKNVQIIRLCLGNFDCSRSTEASADKLHISGKNKTIPFADQNPAECANYKSKLKYK